MSMPIINAPDNPIDREQAINDIIESVALVETGLSHIINAEGEKIQKVVNSDDPIVIDDIIRVNDSASKMINTVSKLEMMLQSKLETTNDLSNNSTLSLYNEIIIPYASTNIYLTTNDDGTPYEGIPLGFSGYTYNNIIMEENIDVLNLDDETNTINGLSFSMPKDGIITGINAFYVNEVHYNPQNDLQITARIYVAKRGSNIYYSTDAMLNLEPKISAFSETSISADGINNNLNIEVKSMDKILFIFYMTHNNKTPLSEYINGTGGGSIIIKTTK